MLDPSLRCARTSGSRAREASIERKLNRNHEVQAGLHVKHKPPAFDAELRRELCSMRIEHATSTWIERNLNCSHQAQSRLHVKRKPACIRSRIAERERGCECCGSPDEARAGSGPLLMHARRAALWRGQRGR